MIAAVIIGAQLLALAFWMPLCAAAGKEGEQNPEVIYDEDKKHSGLLDED